MGNKRKYHQTGDSNLFLDQRLDAKKPGFRISNTGKRYYEYRKNRSDMPNKKV